MVAEPEPDIPPGPYYSSVGPYEGYLLARHSTVMGVLTVPGGGPIGVAYLAGTIPGRTEPIQCWRLSIREGGKLKGKEVGIEGRWVVLNRRFVRLGDAAGA